MKFLFAMQCGRLSGMERVTLTLMLGLMERGHECQFVSMEPIEGLGPLLEEHKIPTYAFDFREQYGIPAFLGLRKLLSASKPDVIIQVGHRLSTTAAILIAGRSSRRIFQSMHHLEDVKSPWVWRGYFTVVSWLFHKITFLTNWAKAEGVRYAPAVAAKSVTLYPPVEMYEWTTKDHKAKARKELQLPTDKVIFGAAGRLTAVKRFDIVLKTFAAVAKEKADAYFVIFGEGEEKPALLELAEQLGLNEQISWLGWQQDMTRCYRALDSLLFTTDMDAFGMVPCEAIAHGTPAVISMLNGGLDEVLGADKSYYLTERDPAQMGNALVKIAYAENADLLSFLRKKVQECCDPDQYVEQVLALSRD